jgi:hypothetical protein
VGAPVAETHELVSVPVHDDAVLAAVCDLAAAVAALAARPYAPQPAGIGTGHWTPAVLNTLYPAVLTGALGQSWNRPILKIKLSVSAAALIVIGSAGALSPGAASYGELVRFRAPAAGVYDFDYGQGMPPAAFGGNGQVAYWSDTAAITVDIEVQHG